MNLNWVQHSHTGNHLMRLNYNDPWLNKILHQHTALIKLHLCFELNAWTKTKTTQSPATDGVTPTGASHALMRTLTGTLGTKAELPKTVNGRIAQQGLQTWTSQNIKSTTLSTLWIDSEPPSSSHSYRGKYIIIPSPSLLRNQLFSRTWSSGQLDGFQSMKPHLAHLAQSQVLFKLINIWLWWLQFHSSKDIDLEYQYYTN